MSDEAVTWPTPAEVAAAGLVAVTTWEEIDAALANGQGPLRTANAAARNFPPVTQGYVTAPSPPVLFTANGGQYSFDNLRPGTYTVTEPAQTGWTQTGSTGCTNVSTGTNQRSNSPTPTIGTGFCYTNSYNR